MTIETVTGTYDGTVYENNGFMICKFYPTGDTGEKVPLSSFGTFTVKGIMPNLMKGEEYEIKGERQVHPTYGTSFNLKFIKPLQNVNFSDEKELLKFMVNITTEARAEALLKAHGAKLSELLEKGDVEALSEVKGVGIATANRLIEQFELHKDYSEAYIVLGDYGISQNTIQKVVKYYKSADKAIEMIRNNPYELSAIDGYSFKKCDELYLKINVDCYNSPQRIRAYIKHFVKFEALEGHSWTGLQKTIESVSSAIGVKNMEVVNEIKYFLDNKELIEITNKEISPRVSNKDILTQELAVALKLTVLARDNTVYKIDGLVETIEKEEKRQGWEFTDQQKKAIMTMANNKVILLEGLAGSGKSTSLKVLLDYYSDKKYTYAQTALSGKASSNLTLITGREGSTIHRLLGSIPNGGFLYDSKNRLPYDIVIIDEVSMIDVNIFYHLVLALRDSAKLIMIGDSEQLEAIGIPVMKPLIDSGVVTRIMLTEIHRQAQKSAVVTHSIAFRNGVVPPTIKAGETVHGELEDLKYIILDDDELIKEEVARAFFAKIKEGYDIMDVQILAPTKSKGHASCFELNKLCQKIYNGDTTKPSIKLKRNDEDFYLRVGDKVINVRNNYKTTTVDGEEAPVFNGNVGIFKEITKHYDKKTEKYIDAIIIDFEGIGDIVIPTKELDSIDLAYCITVHKSQGMGVPHVIVAYPFSYVLINKQSIYTAITRTKKHCTMIMRMKTLQSAVRKDSSSKKRTHLAEILQALDRAKEVGVKE